jgi:hypothetical protein
VQGQAYLQASTALRPVRVLRVPPLRAVRLFRLPLFPFSAPLFALAASSEISCNKNPRAEARGLLSSECGSV